LEEKLEKIAILQAEGTLNLFKLETEKLPQDCPYTLPPAKATKSAKKEETQKVCPF